MPSYRFGKYPPKVDYRTLRFKNYLTAAIAAPPDAYNVLTTSVYPKLKITDPTKLFPIDGNDTLGDCTVAALAHAETIYDGMIGKHKVMQKTAVVKLYMHLTGGVDSGLNELDVLNFWRQNPVSADKIVNYVKIDPKNHTHIQLGIQLFGGVYLGFQVQQNCAQEFDAHQPWTPGPLTNDGHAVYAVAYDKTGVTVLTWGNTQQATWAWWDECVDEAYAILPPEAEKSGFAKGFNFAQLQSDLHDVAS
jgi:hypothetical protein